MNNPENLPSFSGDELTDYADSGWPEEHFTESADYLEQDLPE